MSQVGPAGIPAVAPIGTEPIVLAARFVIKQFKCNRAVALSYPTIAVVNIDDLSFNSQSDCVNWIC